MCLPDPNPPPGFSYEKEEVVIDQNFQKSWKKVETKVAQHVKVDWFKVFPDIQDLWAKSRGKILQGVGQEQGFPLKLLEPLHTLATRAARSAASSNII